MTKRPETSAEMMARLYKENGWPERTEVEGPGHRYSIQQLAIEVFGCRHCREFPNDPTPHTHGEDTCACHPVQQVESQSVSQEAQE